MGAVEETFVVHEKLPCNNTVGSVCCVWESIATLAMKNTHTEKEIFAGCFFYCTRMCDMVLLGEQLLVL